MTAENSTKKLRTEKSKREEETALVIKTILQLVIMAAVAVLFLSGSYLTYSDSTVTIPMTGIDVLTSLFYGGEVGFVNYGKILYVSIPWYAIGAGLLIVLAAVVFAVWTAISGFAGKKDAAADLQDYLFEDYCKNIADAVGENISSLTTVTGAVYGIPSVSEQKDYGILVRKDWMKQVGYTDDAAEAESSGGSLKLLKTMGQFEDMLKKFKTDIGCTIPLAGAPWDLEYVLTSGVVEGQPSYASHSVIYNADGGVSEVIPGYLHDNYDEVLDYAYQWSKEGLWEQFESTTTYTTREQWFYSEQVGVYVGNPKIDELIRISRRLKEYNPEAELTVIGPLSAGDADGNVTKDAQGKELKGFRAEASAYSGLVINPRSKNQELMLEYLNWVYASKENYELCAYGIEGEDWIRVGEDEFSYPSESYITKPSYSGTLKLLENKNISDRTYTGYTAAEKKWIATARNAECYEDALTGMFLFKPADETYNNFISAQNKMVTEVIYKAWNGSIDPKVSQPGESDGVKYFYSVASDYVDWMTKQYLLNKA